MKQLLILALCVACSLAANLERRRLQRLQRELEERLVARELNRDERGVADPFQEEMEEREMEERDYEYNAEVERELERARRQSTPIANCVVGDIVFVLDSSGSIGIANWQLVLTFVNAIIDRLNVGPLDTHVALITYGNRAHLEFGLTNFTAKDTTAMKAAVSNAKFLDENTNTSGGIWLAQGVVLNAANGGRDKAPKIMIIITDGVSTYDHDKTIPYATDAKSAGTMVVVLGVGNQTSPAELNGMASVGPTGKPLEWEVGGYDMLSPIQDTLSHVACQVPIASNSTQPPQPVNPCGGNVTTCPPITCTNTCQNGFAPDKVFCLTCDCLPPPKVCP